MVESSSENLKIDFLYEIRKNGEEIRKLGEKIQENIKESEKAQESWQKELQCWREKNSRARFARVLAKDKIVMESIVSKPFVADADSSADEFSYKIEDVESDVANPRTETAEIDSDEVDPDRVNVYNSEAGSDNADSNLMVQTESENEIKHAKSRLRHELNMKWSEEFFIDA